MCLIYQSRPYINKPVQFTDSDISETQRNFLLLFNYTSPLSVLISPSVIPIIHTLISKLSSKTHPWSLIKIFIMFYFCAMYFDISYLVFQFTGSHFNSDHVLF